MGDTRLRLAAVIPYFGPLPVFWPLTVHTMGLNTEIDWHLFTDQHIDAPPPNVFVHATTFEETVARIARATGLPVVIDTPYKLCDFKPSYGAVYAEELSDYDYWAYADVDVVWGRLWPHIAEPVQAGMERVLTLGHLSFLRNTGELSRAYEHEVPGIRSARTAFTTSQHFSFDEFGGWNDLAASLGLATFDEKIFFDMYVDSYRLRAGRSRKVRPHSVFAWQGGRCLELDRGTGEVISEAAYIHLQKRPVRRARTAIPPAGPPAALAFGPVDIVAADDLPDAARATAALERSMSSRFHWTRHYLRFRINRARNRLRRELASAG